MNMYDIIQFPVVTEKHTLQAETGKYAFRVHSAAVKQEIKKAVERVFNVKVVSVNVSNVAGKKKRVRYKAGFAPDWKKAVVTLKEGQKIDFGQ